MADDIEALGGGTIVYLWGETSDGRYVGKFQFERRSIHPREECRVRVYAPAGWSFAQEPGWGTHLADADGRRCGAGQVFDMARGERDGFGVLDWADGAGREIAGEGS